MKIVLFNKFTVSGEIFKCFQFFFKFSEKLKKSWEKVEEELGDLNI